MYGLAATGVSMVVYGFAAVIAVSLGLYARFKARRARRNSG